MVEEVFLLQIYKRERSDGCPVVLLQGEGSPVREARFRIELARTVFPVSQFIAEEYVFSVRLDKSADALLGRSD